MCRLQEIHGHRFEGEVLRAIGVQSGMDLKLDEGEDMLMHMDIQVLIPV